MTDFVVFVFVTIVAFTIISSVVGLCLSIVFNSDGDRTQVIAILADITTSLISALVGFIAGKGQGRAEELEFQENRRLAAEAEKKEQQKKEP